MIGIEIKKFKCLRIIQRKKKKKMTAIITKSYNFTMYNLRCLIVSMEIHRKLLTQKSSHENILLPMIDCYANSHHIWNNIVCKRFYYQSAIKEKINVANGMQQLNKFLSDPENKKRYQILELEINIMRRNGAKVPEMIQPSHWLILLTLPSKRQERKYLCYLWRNEKHKKNVKLKKELKRTQALAIKAEAEVKMENTGEIKYGITYNSMFRHINEVTINHYYNAKLIQAMMFAPKVVFDCSYESYMTYYEVHNCAKQLTLAFSDNRAHVDPMCLYYCNLDKDGLLMHHFQCNIPTLLNPEFPAIVTSQSYLDLFRRDQLFYLTPHCETDITEYDPDIVYIIGAMVDKTNTEPLSLAKAKKDGICMGKLPIEKYLNWGPGSCKNITVNQMIQILLDLRYTGDWRKALQHVPERKLLESRNKQQNKLNGHLKKMRTP